MKTFPTSHRGARVLVVTLALSVSLTVLNPSGAKAADEADKLKDAAASTVQKMKQWQDRMTEKFRDTWEDLRRKAEAKDLRGKPGTTASVDLREQKESYTVRLHLPGRDLEKVDIRLEDGLLRVTAPAEEQTSRYEQTIALDGVSADASPQIDRRAKDRLIVITVPKSSSSTVQTQPAADAAKDPFDNATPPRGWDNDVLARMERMRREMDRIFDESLGEFRLKSGGAGIFDAPRFGSSLDLKEEGGNYVIRAYLPDRDMKNVNVRVEGQTLRIEAEAEESERKEEGIGAVMHRAHYSQVLTLPGPVQADKLKVERKEEGMLVITLPKA